MTSTLNVQSGFATETGLREQNEDYLGVCLGTPGQRRRYGVTAVVADGVGGFKGGRVAAEMAVRTFFDGYYAQPETIGVQRAAARTIESINQWLWTQGRTDEMLENMASTFSALILLNRRAHVLHVGDSRVYQLSDGQLRRLTQDHTLNRPGYSHVLYRGLGIEESVRLDYAAHPLRLHDRFLLCSDGVHGTLGDDRIGELLLRRDAPEEAARRILDAALQAGSADNVSAIVLDVIGLPLVDHADLETAIATLPIGEPPTAGDEVDGFRLTSLLSEGRYSRLFLANDSSLDRPGTDRPLVMKFPQPEVAAEETFRLAFVREAWVAARVRSPWIGEVMELSPGRQTRLYSVMPYYDGETLEARLRRKPALTLAEGVDIAVKLARAVYTLHRAGIIHRDIKPDNVVIEGNGGLKLIDLGVVRLPLMEEFPVGDVPGTPSYMAPELFDGNDGNEASDLFALGVTIYRALSGGQYPYGEVEPFSRPRFVKPVSLSRRRSDIPAWFEQTLARAIAVLPKDRYGDVIDFAQDMENGLARGRPIVTRKRSLYERNPVLFWQCVSLALLLAVLALARG